MSLQFSSTALKDWLPTIVPSNFFKSVCAQNLLCAIFYQHSSIFRIPHMKYVQTHFQRKTLLLHLWLVSHIETVHSYVQADHFVLSHGPPLGNIPLSWWQALQLGMDSRCHFSQCLEAIPPYSMSALRLYYLPGFGLGAHLSRLSCCIEISNE